MSMSKIRDNIYIGSMDDAADINALVSSGVTASLNVAEDVNDPVCRTEQIRQVKIGLGDFNGNNPYMKELAVHCLKMMLANNEIILVHCAVGASRSVWVVCKALADLEGKDPRTVLEEVQSKRPIALYGPLFENRP